MSSFTFNLGSYQVQHQDLDFLTDTMELLLVKDTYTPDRDDTSAVYAAAEISVAGYTGGFGGSGRRVLGSKTLTNDTANNRTVYDAADPASWLLDPGEDVSGAIVGKKGTLDDTDAVPLFFIDFGTKSTNGTDFVFAFDPSGLGYTQQ